ncbi:beta-1,4-galactosyltransferase 3-like [Cynoglossus semilaevis]|uniref:beta-1,4-galactosyltransferase 3-like n=1 Tax=Cynoglossus semilaevis TaxID=244447 RepID=UPI000494E0CF|nr:beta-1,4-galactosyltransferase 3-like [Cynoglossus semilaevis]
MDLFWKHSVSNMIPFRPTWRCLLGIFCSGLGMLVLFITSTGRHMNFAATLRHFPVLPSCPKTSPLISGPIDVTVPLELSLEEVEKENNFVELGGRYRPPYCVARYRTAIIIPFRNRDLHLKIFLHYIHPLLQRQQLNYGIYVINQAGNYSFNRAKLMNVGFWEAMLEETWDCVFFHDVDLIPEDDRNIYICDDNPKHASIAVNKFNYILPYSTCFGGVSALTPSQFYRINGFPNNYWGWGGEDDDVATRVFLAGMKISRPAQHIGRYKMIKHQSDLGNTPNPKRFDMIAKTKQTWMKDGWSTTEYKVISKEYHPLYTNITVNIGTIDGLQSSQKATHETGK